MSSDFTSQRLTAVRNQFDAWEIDGLLITSPANCRWLSAFTGSNCTLLVTLDQALLGTDFRYWEQATQQAPAFELVKMGRTEELAKLKDMVALTAAGRIGLEANHVTLHQFQNYQKQAEQIEWVGLSSPLARMRHVKSAAELEIMQRAAAITDWAMAQVNELFRPGMSERAAAWELEKLMRERGADGVAFEIIVAGGPNAALAHHRPGDRPLQEGDSIVVDMGAVDNGYHSDLTRSFHLGSEPDDQFWHVYDLVLEAQTFALENVKAGMTGADMDALARNIIAAAGHADHFGHSLGHGVGLEIHEGPTLSSVNENAIPAGAVVTVEPGVYIPGWGGVRIEDLVVITESGIQSLSHCPKNPLIAV